LNDEEKWVTIEFVLAGAAEEMESKDAIVDKGELKGLCSLSKQKVFDKF